MRALLLTGLLAAGCYAAEFADAIDADAGAPLESAALADGWQCETVCGNYLPCWPEDPYGARWAKCMDNCAAALPYVPPGTLACLLACETLAGQEGDR